MLWLLACFSEKPVDDDTQQDTAILALFIVGAGTVDQGEWGQGTFGYEATNIDLRSLCLDVGQWAPSGTAADGCPDCTWAFELETSQAVPVGDTCEQLGLRGGEWTGFRASFGWTDSYAYGSYLLAPAILYYAPTYAQWVPIAYNYDGGGTYYTIVYGDDADFSFRSLQGFYGYVPYGR